MQKFVKMSLKRKMSRKWTNGQNIYDSGKNVTPGVHLPLLGAIYMYMTIIKFISIYPRSQVSVSRTIGPPVRDFSLICDSPSFIKPSWKLGCPVYS